MPKLRNAIIFFLIAAVVAGGAYALWKPDAAPETTLITTPGTSFLPDMSASGAPSLPGDTTLVADNFLSLLLNVQNVRLEDAVLSDPAFKNLRDSSIELSHDGTEGRSNPFDRLGSDTTAPPDTAAPPETPPAEGTEDEESAPATGDLLEDIESALGETL